MKISPNNDKITIGGSIFWMLLVLLSLMSLVFLLIWSFFNNSIQAAVVALIFFAMIVSGIILTRLMVFDLSSWGNNTLSFTIGFVVYLFVGSLFPEQSIIGENYLFATLSTTLPQIIDLTVNVFLVPIAEEMVWILGLPVTLMTIMDIVGKKYDIWKNGWLQIFVVIVIGSFTFAIFHQGQTQLAFIISSIIFRAVLIFLIYGEQKFDIIKGVKIAAAFAVGAHMANNLVVRGIIESLTIINSNLWPIGIIIYAFFLLMFISGIEAFLRLVNGNTKKEVI